MAGFYIHIPFCQQACSYCNFHFSTNQNYKQDMVDAICLEIRERQDEYQHSYTTLYFGGGTPSCLSPDQLKQIITTVEKHTEHAWTEVTLEANPEDLTNTYLKALQQLGINRLSVGIQTFSNQNLKLLNRLHDAEQAEKSIREAAEIGFKDISIDLIYGLPYLTQEQWLTNLNKAFDLPINHFSAYALTVEPNTLLSNQVDKKQITLPKDILVEEQYNQLVEKAKKKGFRHYEVSNYAKPGHEAVHNSNYWRGKTYIGIGPGAHSFDGKHRRWNISNNPQYIKKIKDGAPYWESETLSISDRINEQLMIGLRTMWGVDLESLENIKKGSSTAILKQAQRHLQLENLVYANNSLKIPENKLLLSDGIIADLFIDDE